jgi:hypothetical protein
MAGGFGEQQRLTGTALVEPLASSPGPRRAPQFVSFASPSPPFEANETNEMKKRMKRICAGAQGGLP